LLAAM